MAIAITGASGGLGRSTAERLLQLADPREVVLTTRNPAALADLAARGAQVRRIDFTEPDTFPTAFAGVERLLLISTDAVGARLDQHKAAIAGAAEAGVRHIVYTSVPEPVPGNPALVVPDHAGTEQALRESGLKWTMLRNNLYAHMQVPAIRQMIATGRYVTNTGDGATAYVTREDCAAVAAAVLTQDGLRGPRVRRDRPGGAHRRRPRGARREGRGPSGGDGHRGRRRADGAAGGRRAAPGGGEGDRVVRRGDPPRPPLPRHLGRPRPHRAAGDPAGRPAHGRPARPMTGDAQGRAP